NVTFAQTQGKGDVSDPEVSFDGKKIIFSMRREQDPAWHIWEYDIDKKDLHPILLDNGGDDVDPAYLPDGRIVFSSNRQKSELKLMRAQGREPYLRLDEYEREPVITLHVMNADGSNVHQISFNQSHDRNPTVLSSGKILFSRWDHVGGKNKFTIFTTNPDGTGLFTFYGAFSGNSFLHPREMEDGRLVSDLMPLSGTHEGGAVMLIDVQKYSESTEPDPNAFVKAGLAIPENPEGQLQATPNVKYEMRNEISPNGRYSTPYPLYDGSGRILASWTPSRPEERESPLTGEPEEREGDPRYNIVLIDPDQKRHTVIATAPEGYALLDPIPLMKRALPNVIPDTNTSAQAGTFSQNGFVARSGKVNVFSVYDTDNLGRMGDPVLLDEDKADSDPTKREMIPKIAPTGPDNRPLIADLATLKDPLKTPPDRRPARFVRILTSVATAGVVRNPDGSTRSLGFSRDFIGETDIEMQRILGYAEIQPDGSFRAEVPADVPLLFVATDKYARALNFHTSWVHVAPGQERGCNGCHSPRRGNSINTEALRKEHPHVPPALAADAQSGETMAETRTRVYPADLQLKADPTFVDVWTDPALATPATSFTLNYDGVTTAKPSNGLINYPTHIQPLWTKSRGTNGADTCTNCHNNKNKNSTGASGSQGLDLRAVIAGTGRMTSYQNLLVGDPILDASGQPVITVDNDEVEIEREAPLVEPGNSRASHLIEVLFNEELKADKALANPRLVDHSGMLNDSEKRLVTEWIDVGAQYYNDPYIDHAGDDGVYSISELRSEPKHVDETVFASTIEPILMKRCASCHQPFGGTGEFVDPTAANKNSNFKANRFVLTGNARGDLNVTLTMINNIQNPAQSYLLLRPSSVSNSLLPHPGSVPVLPTYDADYQTIYNWINAANQ
ncbi:MAG TPA: hypothetical protein VFM46_19530, partial [Pseudomonadales bacterium]|nr:hypothetical protein [Pseudomonadales bacterium]